MSFSTSLLSILSPTFDSHSLSFSPCFILWHLQAIRAFSTRPVNKVVGSASEAIADITDGTKL